MQYIIYIKRSISVDTNGISSEAAQKVKAEFPPQLTFILKLSVLRFFKHFDYL